MKLFWKVTLISFLALGLSHLLIRWLDPKVPTVTKQSYEGFDLRSKRIKQENVQRKNIDSWSWVDKRKGYVRIPVDRAMDYYLRSQH